MPDNKTKNQGTPSGFRDVLPSEMLLQNKLIKVLTHVVEKYGFAPISTPTVEWMDTLAGHDDTGGKLIYRAFNGYELPEASTDLAAVSDKGLRFDLTVGTARFVKDHFNQIQLPFRRYQMGQVFRGESAQVGKGRYREFVQFDADNIGAAGVAADSDAVALVVTTMQDLELPATVHLNNRQVLDGLMEVGGVTNPETKTAILIAIDKVDKIGIPAVLDEVTQLAPAAGLSQLVADYLAVTGSNQEKITQLQQLLAENPAAERGLANIKQVLEQLAAADLANHVTFSPKIVRGLGYYTGIILETVVTGYEKYGSVASGGRYDRLINDLGGPDLPAVGLSFGVSRLLDVLQAHGWQATVQNPAQVLVALFDERYNSTYAQVAQELRQASIGTVVYSEAKKIGAQMKYAAELGLKLALIIGEAEITNQTVVIRDLTTREQKVVARAQLVAEVRKAL